MPTSPVHVATAFATGQYAAAGGFVSTGQVLLSYGMQLAHLDNGKVVYDYLPHRLGGPKPPSATTARHMGALERAWPPDLARVPWPQQPAPAPVATAQPGVSARLLHLDLDDDDGDGPLTLLRRQVAQSVTLQPGWADPDYADDVPRPHTWHFYPVPENDHGSACKRWGYETETDRPPVAEVPAGAKQCKSCLRSHAFRTWRASRPNTEPVRSP